MWTLCAVQPFVSNTTFPMLFDTAVGNSTTGVCPAGYLPSNAGGFFECLSLRVSPHCTWDAVRHEALAGGCAHLMQLVI